MFWTYLSRAADFSGILGFFLTILLTAGAVKVKRAYDRRRLLPGHIDKIAVHVGHLGSIVGGNMTLAEVAQEIGQLRGDLNSARQFLFGHSRKTLNGVMRQVDAYSANPTEANMTDVVRLISQLHAEMKGLSAVIEY